MSKPLTLKDIRTDKPVTHWFEVIRKNSGLKNKVILALVNAENEVYYAKWGHSWGLRRPVCAVADKLKITLPSVGIGPDGKFHKVWHTELGLQNDVSKKKKECSTFE
jgi:hypothetical protein